MSLPPVPFKTKVLNSDGVLTHPWAAWFRQLVTVILGASVIDATTAANAAASSASSASSSASLAQQYSESIGDSVVTAAASASGAAASASSAVDSAISAAASAAEASGVLDTLSSQPTFQPDYIDSVLTVPAHKQFIVFQHVTVAPAGSLRILGRGRIL